MNERTTTVLTPKWYTTAQVAEMLGFGLYKTKMLIATGELRSLKDGKYRRILPEWVDEYVADAPRRPPMTAKRARANGEGSIFPYRNGYAAYVWVDKPDGKRARKYVYGQDTGAGPRQMDQTSCAGQSRSGRDECSHRGRLPGVLVARGGPTEPRTADRCDLRNHGPALHRSRSRL